MFNPIDLPPASCAPRFAASMIPGPPPEHTTKRRRVSSSDRLHSVSLCANCRASVLSRKSWSRYASGRWFAICEKLYHFHQFNQGALMVHRSIATLAAVFAATLVVTGVAASTAAPQAKPPAAPAHEQKQSG